MNIGMKCIRTSLLLNRKINGQHHDRYTWLDKNVCKLIVVKVLHTSLLNTTVVNTPLGKLCTNASA